MLELKMNTNVRRGVELVRDPEVEINPVIDLDNVRYLLDVDTFIKYGGLIWTRFDLNTMLPLDETSFTRRYAAHNIFGELLLGSNIQTLPLQTDLFPEAPVIEDNGTVIP